MNRSETGLKLKVPAGVPKGRGKILLPLLIAALPFVAGCKQRGMPAAGRSGVREISLIELYNYSPSSEFEERIGRIPEKTLDFYRKLDGRRDYSAYEPSMADTKLVLKYLRLLPPVFERTFRERCVGLYFVKGFAGAGATDWVVDARGGLYFYMALNPDVLKSDLSAALTRREKSCFIPSAGSAVAVDAGKKYKGLAYALFHEGAHAVDYIHGITPFVEPDFPKRYLPPGVGFRDFFTRVWMAYSLPGPASNYRLRSRLTFYGLGGPRLNYVEAPALYNGLAGSPFVSLYGSTSWAEDFAELAAFGMIVRKLGQPYRIILTLPGSKPLIFEPMRSSKALLRADEIMRRLESL